MEQFYASLPAVNATLNAVNTVLITVGYIQIRRRRRTAHRQIMIAASIISAVFLVLYLIKTWALGTTTYGGTGMMRVLYFTILFSHLTLAMAVIPMIGISLVQGFRNRFAAHRAIGRWTYPIWIYVSFTGVLVHLLLRPWY